MSTDSAATQTPPPAALVPSNAYLVTSDDDDDTDDIVPMLDRIQASGKEGRFYDRSGGEKVAIGDSLRVVILHAPQSQSAWVPKQDAKKNLPAHPDLQFLTSINIDAEKPFCKNDDLKRQQPRLGNDVTPAQEKALRAHGWTGNCQGCPFRKFNRESKSSTCREGRDVLMKVSGRDMPARMSVDGSSLTPFKRFLKSAFTVKDENGKVCQVMPFSKVTALSFKSEDNAYGNHFALVAEASDAWLPEEQVATFREMRESYLLHTRDDEGGSSYVDEPVDHEATADGGSPPPPGDDDAPIDTNATSEQIAGKYF